MVTENNTPSTQLVNLLTIIILEEFPFYINNIYKNNGVQIFQILNKLFKYWSDIVDCRWKVLTFLF